MSEKNIFGEPLQPCCHDPATGFYRDGYCRTDMRDAGRHVVCAILTQPFLDFTKAQGNDLSTPRPEYGFDGLKAGQKWCLCAVRWKEALDAGIAPPIILESCHEKMLDYVSSETLKQYASEDA